MKSLASIENDNKENIYIFDFDGTLYRHDLLILYLIYHFFTFNDKIFLFKSFVAIKDKRLSSIRKKIFLHFASKYELIGCFKRFSKIFFIKYFIRKKLFIFFKKLNSSNKTIFIITANYRVLIKAFLEENNIVESINFKIVGTELPINNKSTHKKILRGELKEKKLLEIVEEKRIKITDINIYNFFDSYEDKYLCKHSRYNILISTLNLKKKIFFKKNYNAIYYNDFLKKI
tara:strand:- start:809 stop:1501 length:693 start_codon:yes stop_codon:yes gene_type:complete